GRMAGLGRLSCRIGDNMTHRLQAGGLRVQGSEALPPVHHLGVGRQPACHSPRRTGIYRRFHGHSERRRARDLSLLSRLD
ncbi:MAG: hypothetical protein P8X82_04570, partial [Gemmatimonadales bacterium]